MRILSAFAASTMVLACAGSTAPASVRITAPPSSLIVMSGDGSLGKRAEDCFADPACPMERAAHDFVLADDVGATNLDCFRFYYGTGVRLDLPRARRCFARTTRRAACDGSPNLDRVYLATMLIDGQGGPTDALGAAAALEGCFADMSVSGVLEAKRTAAPIDFCRDIGGTTLSMLACSAQTEDRATFAFERFRKKVEPSLTPTSRVLLREADAAFAVFSGADSDRAGDEFRGGSLENLTYAARRASLVEGRAARLEALFSVPPRSAAGVNALETELQQKLRAGRDVLDDDGRKRFDAAEAAFRVYLAKEVAFCIDRGALDATARIMLLRDRLGSLD